MAITYEYHYGNGGFILSKSQQEELEKLLIKQLALAGTGAKSLAVPLYDKILSYLPAPDINIGEYLKVYTWLQGAREVNNDSNVYSVFIRNYTQTQYELRYGGLSELELSILDNKINEASNKAASHASNMDQLVDQYVQLHSEMITDRFTLPTSSDLWYA